MHQNIIYTLTAGLSIALVLGFITQRLKLSPIIGYLIAGMCVGPFSPGFVADSSAANQFAEIGIILLMFGIGLHFHIKDLLAVKNIAIPGAVTQILITTLFSMFLAHLFGWGWSAGVVFGIAISVASTVVLTRVLAENHNLHTPTGHLAIGWLIVEDLFTIFVLVLLPAFFTAHHAEITIGWAFVLTIIKLTALVAFALAFGRKLLPLILSYVAKTGARDLFTLIILVLALGMAVGAAEFFGASMALGAFLAGLVVGQSDFSARAASEALPMRDAFAVLFFVSVGMLFNPFSLASEWDLVLAALFIVLVVKPVAAFIVVKLLGGSATKALSVGISLAQIGEFSFILAGLGVNLGVLPAKAASAIIVVAIISITLNPLLYRTIEPVMKFFRKKGFKDSDLPEEDRIKTDNDHHRVILVGYGPVGRVVSRILRFGGMDVVVIELNIDTVKEIKELKDKGLFAVYGDASNKDVLLYAGIENAEALIISPSNAPASEIVEVARSLNSDIKIIIHTNYLAEATKLEKSGVQAVFSGEGAAAADISKYLMCELSIMSEEFEAECRRINGI